MDNSAPLLVVGADQLGIAVCLPDRAIAGAGNLVRLKRS